MFIDLPDINIQFNNFFSSKKICSPGISILCACVQAKLG